MAKKSLFVMILTVVLCLFNSMAFASFEYGDDGQEVLAMQKRLAELQYNVGDLDGIFGEDTEKAIKKYQADKKLDVDGIVGEETYKSLMNKQLPPNRSSRSAIIRRIVRAAQDLKGVPYVFGGTSPYYGFDCSGFTQYVFASAGVWLPRLSDAQYYHGRHVALNDLRTGDLVFFETYEPGASHCGIYIGDGKFIHAGSSTGITVAKVLSSYWAARYYGACRVI